MEYTYKLRKAERDLTDLLKAIRKGRGDPNLVVRLNPIDPDPDKEPVCDMKDCNMEAMFLVRERSGVTWFICDLCISNLREKEKGV